MAYKSIRKHSGALISKDCSHITSKELIDGVELKIPSDKNWFLVIFLLPFILIWGPSEVVVILLLIFKAQDFIYFYTWVFAWTGGGLFIFRTWLWHAFGKTIISIEGNTLAIRKQMDIFIKPKLFQIDKIKYLHIQNRDIETTMYFTRRHYLFSDKTRTIAFEYENRIVRAVDWLDADDAFYVFNKLRVFTEALKPVEN